MEDKLMRLFTALKRIAAYDSLERLRRDSERSYGLDYEEALEMAYDNVLEEAKSAIKGMRAPKPRASEASTQNTK